MDGLAYLAGLIFIVAFIAWQISKYKVSTTAPTDPAQMPPAPVGGAKETCEILVETMGARWAVGRSSGTC